MILHDLIKSFDQFNQGANFEKPWFISQLHDHFTLICVSFMDFIYEIRLSVQMKINYQDGDLLPYRNSLILIQSDQEKREKSSLFVLKHMFNEEKRNTKTNH